MRRSFVTAALLMIAAPLATTPTFAADTATPTATLTVTYTGITTPSGKIMIALFDATGWETGKPTRVAMIDAGGKDLSAAFTGLAPGRYAIKSFHDIDGDSKMSTNPFGMPTEPFAFSNNAHGAKGPPTWEAAAFEITASGATQTITIA